MTSTLIIDPNEAFEAELDFGHITQLQDSSLLIPFKQNIVLHSTTEIVSYQFEDFIAVQKQSPIAQAIIGLIKKYGCRTEMICYDKLFIPSVHQNYGLIKLQSLKIWITGVVKTDCEYKLVIHAIE